MGQRRPVDVTNVYIGYVGCAYIHKYICVCVHNYIQNVQKNAWRMIGLQKYVLNEYLLAERLYQGQGGFQGSQPWI